MIAHHAISTVGATQSSPARKRWETSYEIFRSAVGAALTRELFHFSLPTPRSSRLRIGVSLSSFNLSWSLN
jgi:hypothetical protein